MNYFKLIQALPVLSAGIWLLLAAFNNLTDPGTNVRLLVRMMTMEDIRRDNDLGLGLLQRAISDTKFIPAFLKAIAYVQIVIAASLILSSLGLVASVMEVVWISRLDILMITNLSIFSFFTLWAFFLIGGLWFGYWIKMGIVQNVHFVLILYSILLMIVVNLKFG